MKEIKDTLGSLGVTEHDILQCMEKSDLQEQSCLTNSNDTEEPDGAYGRSGSLRNVSSEPRYAAHQRCLCSKPTGNMPRQHDRFVLAKAGQTQTHVGHVAATPL